MTSKDEAQFEVWAKGFDEQYGRESRLAKEFKLTRTLSLASRRWTAFADELVRSKTGHPRARWQALSALSFSKEPIGTLDLAQRMALRWPTLIRVLNELEAQGLVSRDRDASDGRLRLIAITPAGLELVARVREILNPARHEVLSQFSDAELELTESVLGRLLTSLVEDFGG